MAFREDELFQQPTVDFGAPPRLQTRYTDGFNVSPSLFGVPSAPRDLYGYGMGAFGMGYYGSTNLEQDKAAALQSLDQIDQVVQAAGQVYANIQATNVSAAISQADGIMQSVNAASKFSQDARAKIAALVPPGGAYSDMWLGAAAQTIQPLVSNAAKAAASLPAQVQPLSTILTSAQRAASQASAAAQAQAANQAQAAQAAQVAADNSKLNGAIQQATAFAGQGNFAGALAVLQQQDVIDAASRLGRAGDLNTFAASISYQQKQQADTATRLAQMQSDCSAKGGSWNGQVCDMSAAQAAAVANAQAALSAKVDGALGQADALAAAQNFRGALLVLSGVMGAAAQAGRQTDVQLKMADIQQQQADVNAQARAASDAAAQAAAQAKVSAQVDAALAQADAFASSNQFDLAISSLNSIMPVAAQAGRVSDVIAKQTAIASAKQAAQAALAPAPVASGAPAPSLATGVPGDATAGQAVSFQDLVAAIVAAMRGQGGAPGGGGMSMNVPGSQQSGGAPSFVDASTKYSGDFGPENF